MNQEQISERPGHYAAAAGCPFFENVDEDLLNQNPGFSFGISRERAVNTRKKYWRMSEIKWVAIAMPERYFIDKELYLPGN